MAAHVGASMRFFVKLVQSWSRSPLFAQVPPEVREFAERSVPWRTEPLVYQSDLRDRLPAGLTRAEVVDVRPIDDLSAAVWLCEVKVVAHDWSVADLVVGFKHELLGPESPQVSLDTYGSAPVLAIGIELVFALGCVYAFLTSERRRGRPLTRGRTAALYAVFVIGIMMWLPATSTSLRQTFALFS